MSLRQLAIKAYTDTERPRWLMGLCALAVVVIILLPTVLDSYRASRPDRSPIVLATDSHLRFINTAVQVALPILQRDPVGILQLAYVAAATTAATHGLKFLLDARTVGGVRLGERPNGPNSRYNMPSGHSSMASSAMYFVSRRYGWRHLWYMVPILLLTMYARVALEAHTNLAVVAGAPIGLLAAMAFTGKRQPRSGAQVLSDGPDADRDGREAGARYRSAPGTLARLDRHNRPSARTLRARSRIWW